MFIPTTDGNVVENFILYDIILFISAFLLFYFNFVYYVILMILLYRDVIGDYICEVLRCNDPLVSWQMKQPIFILH